MFFAHSHPNRGPDGWQRLEEHLWKVANRARGFGEGFETADWAELAGLWHDLGKYQDEFQELLAGEPRQVDHSSVGAGLAMGVGKGQALGLALAIAGHHGGLADVSGPGERGDPTPLQMRLSRTAPLLKSVLPSVPQELRDRPLPELPARFSGTPAADAPRLRSYELWTRFLFSCLVDADFLDTEAFLQGDRRAAVGAVETIPDLRATLTDFIDKLSREAEPSEVNRARAAVLQACRTVAQQPTGFFSLTVPTGGGKTLSAMEFALRHAEAHGLERVIAAIPYTSIIDQTAAVYKRALGRQAIVEHHSSLDPQKETVRNRLASENWDAPIVVTTNVQLFESLFANTPSRCRKLHNVTRSVLLLDEVQSLPSRFLIPITEVLTELVEHYGCSVVLSTATQPALRRRQTLPSGIPRVREIMPDPPTLFRALKRVDVDWSRAIEEPITWEALAAELSELERVLVVVHRRQDARDLAGLLPAEGRFHLSALMCGAHRKSTIERIRTRLDQTGPCRVVSTQLIEAGVDVDFPVVYRAMAGLDSITQAAGRCNREGRHETGRVVVFRAPTPPPRGTPQKALAVTEGMLREGGGSLDIADPGLHEDFFRRLYFREDLDAAQVQPLRAELKLAQVAGRVKLIEDGYSQPVLVPYGEGPERFEALRALGPSRERLRALQPFLVNVYDHEYRELAVSGALQGAPDEGPLVHGLVAPFLGLYDPQLGLVLDPPLRPDPEALVVSGGGE